MNVMKPTTKCFLGALALMVFPLSTQAQMRAEIVRHFPSLGKGDQAVRVSFCPQDPTKALAHVGERDCFVNVEKGKIDHFDEEGQVVDWIGDQLLLRSGDAYALVENDSLESRKDVQATQAAAEAAVRVSEKPVLVGRGKDARIVRASDRKTLFKAPFLKGIYGFETNADASKWVIYLGEAEYLLYDAVKKKKYKLPQTVPGTAYGFSAWKPSPDGTAIGEVGLPPEGVHPDSEEAEMVGRTLLYHYDPATKQLQGVALPVQLGNKVLQVLDSGQHGYLFLGAREPGNGRDSLGAFVVRLAEAG